MTDDEINDTFKSIVIALEMQRARSDVLSLVVKHTLLSLPQAAPLIEKITRSLSYTGTHALFSTETNDAYTAAFDAEVQVISSWLPPQKHGA